MKSKLLAASVALLGCLSGGAPAAEVKVNVRDLTGKPLEDAVVYLEPAGKPVKPAESLARTSIDQVNRQFVPLVTVLRTGTEVSFPNSDNIRHSIYSFSPAKTFTTKLYSGRQAPPVVFDKAGLVVLGCNIHDTMAAWVVVVDTPYFNKSGADGVAAIQSLDRGDYRLSVWYPGPQFEPAVSQIHVESDEYSTDVKVDSSASSLPALRAKAPAKPAARP